MADDVTLRWGATGFEKIEAEFGKLDKLSERIGSTMGKFSERINKAWENDLRKSATQAVKANDEFIDKLQRGMQTGGEAIEKIGHKVLDLAEKFGVLAAAAGIGAIATISAFTHQVIEATDKTKSLELSLYGATKSYEAVGKAQKFAQEFAEKYPVTVDQVLKSVRDLASIPATKKIVEKGDVEEMEKYTMTLMRLSVIRPEMGFAGAENAIKAAMMGRWVSLQRQYYIRPEEVAETTGVSKKAMQANPMLALAGIEKLTEQRVGLDAVNESMRKVSSQMTVLHNKWEEFLKAIGKTGIYNTVVDHLAKLNSAIGQFMKTDQFRTWVRNINDILEDFVNGISRIFTGGIDWTKVTTFSGLVDAFKKVSMNAYEEMKKIWEDIKAPLGKAVGDALNEAIAIAINLASDFIPKAMEKVGTSLVQFYKKMAAEHPMETGLGSALVGYEMGKATKIPGASVYGAASGYFAGTITSLSSSENWGAVRDYWKKVITEGPKEFAEKVFSKSWWSEQANEVLGWFKSKAAEAGGGFVTPAPTKPGIQVLPGEEHAWPERRAAMSEWMASSKEIGAVLPIEKQFQKTEMWAKMAGKIAQIPTGEPQTAGYQFATGKIGFEEWSKRKKVEGFQAEYEKKLTGITEITGPESAPTRMKAYEQLFGLAAGRGDVPKAQEYMAKALDELKESQKTVAERAKEAARIQEQIEANTKKTADLLEQQGQGSGKAPAQSPSATPQSDQQQGIQQDEIRFDVKRGYTNTDW